MTMERHACGFLFWPHHTLRVIPERAKPGPGIQYAVPIAMRKEPRRLVVTGSPPEFILGPANGRIRGRG